MHPKETALCERHGDTKCVVPNNMTETCRELKGLSHVQWEGETWKSNDEWAISTG